MFVERDPFQDHGRQMLRRNIARAPIPTTGNAAQTANSPSTSSADNTEALLAPVRTPILAALATFFGLSLILVTAVCIYRKRQRKTKETFISPASRNTPLYGGQARFHRGQHIKADLKHIVAMNNAPAPKVPAAHRIRVSETSTSSNDLPHGIKVDRSVFKNTDVYDSDVKDPFYRPLSIPQPAALEKPSRARPAWMEPIKVPNTEIGSPPPSYAVASGGVQELCVPLPPLLPPQKLRQAPAPPTPPMSRKSKSAPPGFPLVEVQVLEVPEQDEQAPVVSPARSSSFAALHSPVTSQDTHGARTSQDEHEIEAKLPRMMSVIRPFAPSLEDELTVKVGDTLRVLEEYNDGWCFAQLVGGRHPPRGVVPLVCLEGRRRIVPSGPMVWCRV